ncbi:hypothetical protein CRYUN_Cryun26dG0127000 [Craigia yunnanensis]
MLKRIWAANIPSKIRIFTWRVCHEIIPVFTKLHQRHIDVQTTCPRSQQEEETTIHVLRDFKNAEDVWNRDATTTPWLNEEDRNTLDWIFKCSRSMSNNSFELGLITMWAIWNSRNAFVINGESRTAKGTWKSAEGYHQEIQNSNNTLPTQLSNTQHWRAPPVGVVKINFDGSLRTKGRKGGIGAGARDSSRSLLGFCQDTVNGVIEPNIIELYAVTKAMEWGYQMGVTKLKEMR